MDLNISLSEGFFFSKSATNHQSNAPIVEVLYAFGDIQLINLTVKKCKCPSPLGLNIDSIETDRLQIRRHVWQLTLAPNMYVWGHIPEHCFENLNCNKWSEYGNVLYKQQEESFYSWNLIKVKLIERSW